MNLPALVPIWILVALAFCLVGCDGGEKAYAKGWNDGYEEGRVAGVEAGKAEAEVDHQTRWGWIGLGIGALRGGAVVALLTRKYLAEQWRRRQRRKEVERFVGTCKAELDADLHADVMVIARKKAALRDRLSA